VGSKIDLRVGGDFYLDLENSPPSDSPPPLLLIAGGVGVNPLLGMMAHAAQHPDRRGYLHLIYSAKTSSQILYRVCTNY